MLNSKNWIILESILLNILRKVESFIIFASKFKKMKRYFYILMTATTLIWVACDNGTSPSTSTDDDKTTTSTTTANNRTGETGFHPDAESPDIRIVIEGMPQGLAYLNGIFTNQPYRADSVQVKGNELVFKRDDPYRYGLYYCVFSDNSFVQFLIDQDQTFTMTANANDLIGTMKVEGDKDNDLFYQSLKFEQVQRGQFDDIKNRMAGLAENSPAYQQIMKERDGLVQQRKDFLNKMFADNPGSFFTSFKKAGQNPTAKDFRLPDGTLDNARQVYFYRTEMFDGVDMSDERLLYTPVIANKLQRYMNELTNQNPDSIIASAKYLVDQSLNHPEYFKYFSNWVALNYDPKESTLMDPQAVYVFMVENYFTYERAFWADSVEVYGLQQRAFEMSASLVGKKAPDVQAKDPSGQLKSIYEITAPYILVYMFNPECEHCAVETPKLVNFYKQWKSRGVEVFAIAIDTDDTKWRDYIAKQGMNWTNVYDPTNKAIYGKYYVDITPELYVLNKDRTIIAKNLKVDQIQTVLERDMNQ